MGVVNPYAIGAENSKPSILNALVMEFLRRDDFVSCFTLFFPFQWLEGVLLEKTNTKLERAREKKCEIGEFLKYLGILILMAYFKGFLLVDFWSKKEISIDKSTLYRFHCYMSGE